MIFYYLVFVSYLLDVSGCLTEVQYFSGPFDNDIICRGGRHVCSHHVRSDQGLVGCLLNCTNRKNCFGISAEESNINRCFIHEKCGPKSECGIENVVSRRYYSKNCAHGGRWNVGEDRCNCVHGWVGSRCKDLPNSPDDLIAFGPPRGFYRSYLDLSIDNTSHLVPVHGYFNLKERYKSGILLLHQQGNVDFNMSMSEYREGFFTNENNIWAGLDKWAVLSQAGYQKMRVILSFKTLGSCRRTYIDFSLSNAADEFRFQFTRSWQVLLNLKSDISVEFGDCFRPYVNTPFSSFDEDKDGDPTQNCASTVGSGWWFAGSCDMKCNLFGWGPTRWDIKLPSQQMYISRFNQSYLTVEEMPTITITLL